MAHTWLRPSLLLIFRWNSASAFSFLQQLQRLVSIFFLFNRNFPIAEGFPWQSLTCRLFPSTALTGRIGVESPFIL